ncbi:hemolysin XhlA family protein [Paenibacillus sp. FSL R7-0337]|uniref:hemolysin XhlA family protein n=1 Tax=Paenibacillus sp. FSL R7-0337 TaxID=1926588 RepID=UPI00096CE451|nr:hemolysin XhlA family protein [Paenibacillus sp. FSL R7-0337]OMF98170.1 hypothetical protein BK147_11150 [Paenibacillus sp. FSL R7-0337]
MGTEDKLVEIQIQLARIEKTLEVVPALTSTVESARDTARDAVQSSKAAHHRLDRIEDAQRWLWRTVGGAIITGIIGVIIAAIKLTGG